MTRPLAEPAHGVSSRVLDADNHNNTSTTDDNHINTSNNNSMLDADNHNNTYTTDNNNSNDNSLQQI